jgi:hypothetical protein
MVFSQPNAKNCDFITCVLKMPRKTKSAMTKKGGKRPR